MDIVAILAIMILLAMVYYVPYDTYLDRLAKTIAEKFFKPSSRRTKL